MGRTSLRACFRDGQHSAMGDLGVNAILVFQKQKTRELKTTTKVWQVKRY